MAALGHECDFVKEVALWYPLRVIMMILGVPPEDERVHAEDDAGDLRAGRSRRRGGDGAQGRHRAPSARRANRPSI